MTEDDLNELRQQVNHRSLEWLAAAPEDSLFRRYLILNMGPAYLFGIMQAIAARQEPPGKMCDALADTIGTILADAATRGLDVRDAERVAGFLWHMSARISTQFSREIAIFVARQEPPTAPGTH